MAQVIDTRGLSCPQPVMMAHQVLADASAKEADVLVDNEVSRENVARAARKQGWAVTAVEEEDGSTRLELRR